MRCGHRRAGVGSRSRGPVARRGDRRERSHTPGAAMSGLSRFPAGAERRDHGRRTPATCGYVDRRPRGRCPRSGCAVAPAVAGVRRDLAEAGELTCTVGTLWRSASREFVGQVDQHHAETAGPLDLVGLLDPGDHAAVADHDLARRLGRVEGVLPGRARRRPRSDAADLPRRRDQRRRADRAPSTVVLIPAYSWPLPSSTVAAVRARPCSPRPWSPRATRGRSVEAPGPLLPAEVATKMPAEAADRKARSTGVGRGRRCC